MSVRARARERLEARESRIVRRQENLLIEREKSRDDVPRAEQCDEWKKEKK